MKHWSIAVLPISLLTPIVACSSSDGNSAGPGGSAAAGAPSANGGAKSSGGTGTSTGGSVGAGGSATSNGGFTTSGGSATTGGTTSAGGSTGAGGKTSAGGSTSGGGTSAGGAAGSGSSIAGAGGTAGHGGSAGASTTGGTGSTGVSVLQYHNNASRDGVYVDAKLSKTAAATLHVDTTFTSPALTGRVYAQPLYLAGSGTKPDAVIVATEANQVYALNASTGAQLWNKSFGTAVSTGLPCGNIATSGNTLGITGTPVIDPATRTLYFDAMTADATDTAKHMIHAVDADTGTERTGWPVDVNAKAKSGSTSFSSLVQNQRAALSLLGGKVIVPYGGHVGDCEGYHGWLVGISTTDPTQVSAWATRAIAGGVWAVGGAASDGTSLF